MTALLIHRVKTKKIDSMFLAADTRCTVDDLLFSDDVHKIITRKKEGRVTYYMYTGDVGAVEYGIHLLEKRNSCMDIYELLMRDKDVLDSPHDYTMFIVETSPLSVVIVDKTKGDLQVTPVSIDNLCITAGSGEVALKAAYKALSWICVPALELLPKKKQLQGIEELIRKSFTTTSEIILSVNDKVDIIRLDIEK